MWSHPRLKKISKAAFEFTNQEQLAKFNIFLPYKCFFLNLKSKKQISEQESILVSDWGDMLEVLIFMCCESFTWLIYDSFTAFISYWNIMMIYCWWLVTSDVIMTSLKTLWWRHLILFQVQNESSHYLKLLSIQSNSFRHRPRPRLQTDQRT